MYGDKLRLAINLEKKLFKIFETICLYSAISSASGFSSFSNKMILFFLETLPKKTGLKELQNLLLWHSVLVSQLPKYCTLAFLKREKQ